MWLVLLNPDDDAADGDSGCHVVDLAIDAVVASIMFVFVRFGVT